jgi:hypothetical protein
MSNPRMEGVATYRVCGLLGLGLGLSTLFAGGGTAVSLTSARIGGVCASAPVSCASSGLGWSHGRADKQSDDG